MFTCLFVCLLIFVPQGDSFTLEEIIDIGLDQFADEIGDISGAASKELAIEEALASISEQWEDLTLDIDRYKDRGHYRLKYALCLGFLPSCLLASFLAIICSCCAY